MPYLRLMDFTHCTLCTKQTGMEYMNYSTTGNFFPTTTASQNSSGGHSGTGLSDSFFISLFVLYIPGTVTNILAIIVMVVDYRKSNMPTSSLLLCLCVTNFFAVSLSCFWHTSRRLGFVMTYEWCALRSFLHPLMPLLTGATGLLLAIDRVLAFCKPFTYRSKITGKLWTIVFTAVLCFLSIICTLPHLGFGTIWTPTLRRGRLTYVCSVFTYQTEWKKRVFHALYTFLGLSLVASIITCNGVVAGAVLLLRNRMLILQKEVSGERRTPSRAREVKFAVIVGVLACVFITCWLPYNVWILYKLFNIPMDSKVVVIIHYLGGFNYSTDPFIYLVIRKTNWIQIRRMCSCQCLQGYGVQIHRVKTNSGSTFKKALSS